MTEPNISSDPNQQKQPWYVRAVRANASLLILMSMTQMLDIINISSVTITLPDIQKDVGYEVTQLQWVISAYALAYAGFLLIGGRLGDLFGHRRIFITGIFWFSIWSLVNGFAQTSVVMSVGRAMQGMGAGFTIPSALAILTTTFPLGPERTKALGVFGGTGAAGAVVGVLFGGIFGATIGWEWIFFFTSILGFFMGFLSFFVIPMSANEPNAKDQRVDYAGAFCFTASIVAFTYYLSESLSVGWTKAQTLAPFIVGIVLFIVFLIIQFRIDYPIMPTRIWRSRRFFSSVITITCLSASINSLIFFSSLTFQNVLGYTPMKTALAYIVHGVGAVVAVGLVTQIIKKVRTKVVIIIGWFFIIAAGCVFAQTKETTSYWSIPFPALILNFIGIAPVWLCSQINSVADAPDEDQGVVGAIYNVGLQAGGPLGLAITNIIANDRIKFGMTGAELVPGYKAAFYAEVVIAGVGLIVSTIFCANQDPPNMHGGASDTASTATATEMDQEQGNINTSYSKSELPEAPSGVESTTATIVDEKSSIGKK